MLFQESGHAQHGDAEVEVVAAIGAGEIDGYHAAVVIDNGRTAGTLHGGDAVHHAVAIGLLGDWNLRPSELEKSITRKHIFTHIVWEMRGIYAQVREKAPEFTWMTPEEINTQAALPTAFRLFWEETEHV